jgi:hypothetical protein
MLLALLATTAFTVSGPGGGTAHADRDTGHTGAHPDWMANIPDDVSLAELSIPGTHEDLSAPDSKAEGATLTHQLRAGIRAVDIAGQSRAVNAAGQNRAACPPYPDSVYQRDEYHKVLGELDAFLQEHPGETILLNMQGNCATGATQAYSPPRPACADREQIFNTRAHIYRDLFWQPSVRSPAEVPTLEEVRGKVVMVNWNAPATGCGRPQPYYSGWAQEWAPQLSCYVRNSCDAAQTRGEWEAFQTRYYRNDRGPDCWTDRRPRSGEMYTAWTSGPKRGPASYALPDGPANAVGVNYLPSLPSLPSPEQTERQLQQGLLGLIGDIIQLNPS